MNKCKYVIRNKRKRKGYVRVYNRAKQGIKKRVKETQNLLSCYCRMGENVLKNECNNREIRSK